MMTYFQIRDYVQLMHYGNRRPAWIKLHQRLLDDPNFCRLAPLHRYALIALMLIASRLENRIPHDPRFLAHALHLDEELDLTPLFDAKFLLALRKHSASGGLANRKQNASPDRDRELDKEKDSPVVPSNEVDAAWIESLRGNPAYQHIDIGAEVGKAKAWLSLHPERKFTKRFFLNWLGRVGHKPATPSVNVSKNESVIAKHLQSISGTGETQL